MTGIPLTAEVQRIGEYLTQQLRQAQRAAADAGVAESRPSTEAEILRLRFIAAVDALKAFQMALLEG